MAGPGGGAHGGGFGGGIYEGTTNSSSKELLSFDFVFEGLEKIYSFLTSAWGFMNTPIKDNLSKVMSDLGLGGIVGNAISDLIGNTFIGNMSLLHLALGGAILYILIIKLINLFR